MMSAAKQCFALFLILGCISWAAYANDDCVDSFRKASGFAIHDGTVDQLDSLEREIKLVQLELERAQSPKAAIAHSLEAQLNEKLEELMHLGPQELKNTSVVAHIKKELHALRTGAADSASAANTSKALPTWTQLRDNPLLIEAGVLYPVKVANGPLLRVKFSEEIIDNFFRSRDDLRKRAGDRFLTAIEKGFISNEDVGSSGIKPLTGHSDVIEVKIIGRNMAMRLGGFFRGNDLHLVHFIERSDHSSFVYGNNFIKAVRAKKAAGY